MNTRALNVKVKVEDRWRCEVEQRSGDRNLSKDKSGREEMVEKTIKEWLKVKKSQEFKEKVWFGK